MCTLNISSRKWHEEHLKEIWRLLKILRVRFEDKGEIFVKLVSLGYANDEARELLKELEHFHDSE